jgi:hypothetical protein
MKFTCSECGKQFPHGNLSTQSILISGQESPKKALQVLDDYDTVCKRCEDLIVGSLEHPAWAGAGSSGSALTNLQKWYYSGLDLNRAQLDWLSLNF